MRLGELGAVNVHSGCCGYTQKEQLLITMSPNFGSNYVEECAALAGNGA